MNTKDLRLFIVLGRTGNMAKTVELTGVSKSTLSKRISCIEEELGSPLFERNGKGWKLTAVGEAFLPSAVKIVDLEFYYRNSIQGELAGEDPGGEKTNLYIGSIPIITPYRIPDLVFEFQKLHQDIRVSLLEGRFDFMGKTGTKGVVADLDERKTELSFINDNGQLGDRFDQIVLYRDNVTAILSKNDLLSGKEHVSLFDLRDRNFYLPPGNRGIHQWCMAWCEEAGFAPKISGEFTQIDTILSMVAKGYGVSVLMESTVKRFNLADQVSMVPLDPSRTMNTCLIRKRGQPLSRPADQFWEFVKKSVAL